MDKLKNILKSDTPDPSQIGTSSYYKGGSSLEQPNTTGSALTGTGSQTGGGTDVSSVPASGTEQAGTGNSGTAAVGQTSTYSSSHLSQGDPTSSVADPSSTDPLTYKRPESGAHPSGSGASGADRASDLAGHENPYRTTHLDPRVDGLPKDSAVASTDDYSTGTGLASGAGAGAAGTGAASALTSSRADDSVPAPSSLTSTADPTARSAEYSSGARTRGLDSAGDASSALPDTSATTDTAPVHDATTTDTTAGTTSGTTTGLGGLTGTSGTSDTTATATDENQPSMVSRALGAVGLGGLAGAFGAGATSSGDNTAVADTSDQPTTTTGIESYTSPTQQGPPSHHRKESIPTTAYPSGTFDSVRAVNPPLGSAGSPVVHGDRDQDASRGTSGAATAGAAVLGAGAGAAAVGSTRHSDSRNLGESTTEDLSGGSTFAHHATTVGEPGTSSATSTGGYGVGTTSDSAYTSPVATGVSSGGYSGGPTSDSTYTGPTTTTTTTTTTSTAVDPKDRDTTARDTALGAGAGAAAVGAGAYGAHEYSKKDAEKEEARERAHQQKELDKQHKAEEKAAAKEEKHHQKDLEKEQKVAALRERREHEAEEQRLRKQREEEAEERKIREERERLTGGGASAGEHEREKEKEKKPSFFRRIFKRRKNKDTGEEEEYSSDDDRPQLDPEAKAAYGATLLSGDHATYGETKRRMSSTGSGSVPTGTGYSQKPSYNPLSKDEPPTTTSSTGGAGAVGATTAAAATTGAAAGLAGSGSQHKDPITGLPYDPSKDPEAARRLSSHTHGDNMGVYDPRDDPNLKTKDTPVAAGGQSTEPITGLPFDPSKDPEAARRISEHTHGTGLGTYDPRDAAAAKDEGADPLAVGTATSTGGYGQDTAPSTLPSTGTRTSQPFESTTGTPATAGTTDQSAAPGTIESTGTHTQQPSGAVTGLPYDSSKDTPATGYSGDTGTGTTTSGGFQPNLDFTLGEITGKGSRS